MSGRGGQKGGREREKVCGRVYGNVCYEVT